MKKLFIILLIVYFLGLIALLGFTFYECSIKQYFPLWFIPIYMFYAISIKYVMGKIKKYILDKKM